MSWRPKADGVGVMHDTRPNARLSEANLIGARLTRTSPMRLLPVLLLAFVAAPALAQQGEQARLQACIEQIDRDAKVAYEDGLAWMSSSGDRPAARHCTALALVAMGQEAEGAFRLEQLANATDAGGIDIRSVYLAQSGNAWLLAKMPDKAVVTFTNAMKLKPRDVELRKDRARAYLMQKKWADAGEDLNSAVEASPGDPEALRMRAMALKEMNRLDEAWGDVSAALKLDAKDVTTVVLRGDIREAMRKAGMPDPIETAQAAAPATVRPVIVGN